MFPSHYLVIMLKRHLVGLYSGVLKELDEEDLERVKKYAEEVDAVYQIIDPGYQKDRGTILRHLCEVHKVRPNTTTVIDIITVIVVITKLPLPPAICTPSLTIQAS